VSTNTFAFFRDNGTGWDLIGGPGTGTITGSGTSGQIALWDGASTITGDTGLTYNGTANSLTASQFIVTGGTSSQFLKADGSVDNNTYNTGSGVAGQVAFFSGTNAITGNNDLFWDNVNGHLGIGTNVPGTALQIDHDQSQLIRLNQTTATNDTKIAFQNSGTALWRIGNSYNAGANDFGIFDVVGAFQPVTVKKTTGQVLIGTSTVGSGKLVVASSTGDNGVQIVGASAPSLRIDNAESGPTKRAGFGISTATNNFIQGSADRDFCMFNGSTTASPILFGIYDTTNVQEAARISPARNFLIGTTTDGGQKLQVNGAIKATRYFLDSMTAGNGALYYSASRLTLANYNAGGTLAFEVNGGADALTISDSLAAVFTGTVSCPALNVLPNISGGGIIIGSASTAFACDLEFKNDVNTVGNFISIVRNANQYITGTLAGDMVIGLATGENLIIGDGQTGTSQYLKVASTGNVLIGTTTDNGNRFQIAGNTFINGNINQNVTSGPTVNVPSGSASVFNFQGGTIISYLESIPPPYTQDIRIDIVFDNWSTNPAIALVDIMATYREFAGTAGLSYGKIFATSASTSTFTSFDTSNIVNSQSTLTASSGGNYTLRIQLNPTSSTDRYGIYMNIQRGGTGVAISSVTISYV
jgi:hypothetical protein